EFGYGHGCAFGVSSGWQGATANAGIALGSGLAGAAWAWGAGTDPLTGYQLGEGIATHALQLWQRANQLNSCLEPGMPLLTSDGDECSERLQEGDGLVTRPEHDPGAALEVRPVVARYARPGRLWRWRVNGRTIGSTPEHGVCEYGKGWTTVGQLRAGDRVRTDSGWAVVEAVE